ncbi:MAG: hypothetical protein LBJ95_02660 [Oscillospiraceae bacterium]|jgi:hypothetical protein|nr:hypothetical protein [Oscillospiraceae bacterium]
MKLNFRKLKNSLLSLGLSATLFCSSGLASLPVFAEPVVLSALNMRLDEKKKHWSDFDVDSMVNTELTYTEELLAHGAVDEKGMWSPGEGHLAVVYVGSGVVAIKIQTLSKRADRAKSRLNKVLASAGYTPLTPTEGHKHILASRLKVNPHDRSLVSWSFRIKPDRRADADRASSDAEATDDPALQFPRLAEEPADAMIFSRMQGEATQHVLQFGQGDLRPHPAKFVAPASEDRIIVRCSKDRIPECACCYRVD